MWWLCVYKKMHPSAMIMIVIYEGKNEIMKRITNNELGERSLRN